MQEHTTYTAESNPNSTKPRQGNNMNVNGYKNAEDTQKQTNIYQVKDKSTAFDRSATNGKTMCFNHFIVMSLVCIIISVINF